MHYVKPFGPGSPFPSMCCQVWRQHLCPILTSSVLHHLGQTLTQPVSQQQPRSVSHSNFEMDPEPYLDAVEWLFEPFKTQINTDTVILSHQCLTYLFASRSGSDASPVLWCDTLGGLPCQPFPAASCCSQQLSQSAGSRPGPAEPTAGQSGARQKTGTPIATGSRCFCQGSPYVPDEMCIQC